MIGKWFACMALGAGVVMTALCEDTYDIKVYPVPVATGAIRIDGALDEPAWDTAPLVGGFTFYNKPTLVTPQAFFRVLHDREALYFGISCDEPLMKKVVPVPQARDARAVFHGETIELFVDPNHDQNDYFQFAVNAAGSVYDSRKTDPVWSAAVRAHVTLHEDHWVLELAIPWDDLGVTPVPGHVLGFNVCRDRLVGDTKLWANWSQTKANFHDPARFAHLVLSPRPEQIGKLGAEFRKGGRRGSVVVFSKEGFAATSYRALASAAIAKLDELVAQLEKTRALETDAATQRELGRLLDRHRAELEPYRRAVAGGEALDAKEWTHMDLRMAKMADELSEAVWRARLTAVLSRI